MVYDLLISEGTVIDGTGRPGFRADIAITGDRIAAIEPKLSHKDARRLSTLVAKVCVRASSTITLTMMHRCYGTHW